MILLIGPLGSLRGHLEMPWVAWEADRLGSSCLLTEPTEMSQKGQSGGRWKKSRYE